MLSKEILDSFILFCIGSFLFATLIIGLREVRKPPPKKKDELADIKDLFQDKELSFDKHVKPILKDKKELLAALKKNKKADLLNYESARTYQKDLTKKIKEKGFEWGKHERAILEVWVAQEMKP